MGILVWAFLIFGITIIISLSNIIEPFRNFFLNHKDKLMKKIGQGLSCPMCSAFWVGIVISFIFKSLTGSFILDGFLASGITWFLYCMVSGPCFNPRELQKSN